MRITAISPHTSNYPRPIELAAGDRVQLGQKDSEYPGWIWVTTAAGAQGWAPEEYIRVVSPTEGFMLKAYTAAELNTVAGEQLISHKELNDWLWVENSRGEKGWIPKQTTSAA